MTGFLGNLGAHLIQATAATGGRRQQSAHPENLDFATSQRAGS